MVYNLMSIDLTRHERKVGHTFAVKRAVRIKTYKNFVERGDLLGFTS